MAAYAALLSLNYTIEQHQERSVVYPPQYPIQSDVKQTITVLLKVFQSYDYQSINEEIVELEKEIAEAAYDVDYVIECLALDPILEKSGGYKLGKPSSQLFSEDEMVQIVNKFLSFGEKAMKEVVSYSDEGDQNAISDVLHTNIMMGYEELRKEFVDHFSDTSNLKIVPVVGMGGIGKTTFVRNYFDHYKDVFDVSIWCTISQSPDIQSVVQSFLHDLGINNVNDSSPGEKLRKRLSGKRYLVVLDDIWGVDVWDAIKSFFPDDHSYSTIIITTRLLSVASYIGTCKPFELRLLNEEASWNLLREKVFGEDVDCPPELEHIGMQIARDCKGLPLVIVVIAGQLLNNITRDSWESVARRLRSTVDFEVDEDWCLNILSYCYESLPIHLKPCFLYMGVFPEDHSIQVSLLINMWVEEGFLKPNGDHQCLEDVAMDYLMDLIQRNLLLVTERSSMGKIKYLHIHDFLRDLCLKKAHEYNFLHSRTYLNLGILPGADRDYPMYLLPTHERSIGVSPFELASKWDFSANKNLMHFRLRCIRLSAAQVMNNSVCSTSLASIFMFQNLHRIIMKTIPGKEPVFLPPQIWEMPFLKHVEIQRVVLPNPPHADSHVSEKVQRVLKNMQTLLNVYNFNFSEEMCKMFQNLKKLKMTFTEGYENSKRPVYGKISAAQIAFLQSLRSLRLDGSMIPWEDMAKVGSFPNLEKLILWNDAFCGSEWRTIEGQFCNLKALHLGCLNLEHLRVKRSHFPVLERLAFYGIQRLKEIPEEIGYIQTLRLVSLEQCCTSLSQSAYELKTEQERLRNNSLRVQIDSPVHFVICDYCEKEPIVGVRYRCKDCTEEGGFDLCEVCYSSGLVSDHPGFRKNKKHTSEHEFEILTSRSGKMANLSKRMILEKYTLTGLNFMDWIRNIRLVLRQQKIEYVLDEPIPTPPTAAAELANFDKVAHQKHKDDAANAQCVMLAAMTMELRSQHENMMPYEMFVHLKSLNETVSNLLVEIIEMRMSEGGNVSEHMLKMIGLIEKLAPAGIKFENPLSVAFILQSLPDSYSTFILNNMNAMDATLTEIHNMLKTYEQAQPKKVVNMEKDTCLYCKQKGHWKRDCPKAIADGVVTTHGASGSHQGAH